MTTITTPETQFNYEYSIEQFDKKEYVYVVVHEHAKIDTEILVFQHLSDAVEKANKIAEADWPRATMSSDDIEQRHCEGVVYALHYPVEGHVWIVRREIQ